MGTLAGRMKKMVVLAGSVRILFQSYKEIYPSFVCKFIHECFIYQEYQRRAFAIN